MERTPRLNRESLTELVPSELTAVAGAAATIGYHCMSLDCTLETVLNTQLC